MHIEIPADLGVTEEQARLYSSRAVSLARAARLAQTPDHIAHRQARDAYAERGCLAS